MGNLKPSLGFLKNGTGKSYLPNGDWVSEFFIKGEKKIKIVRTSTNGSQSLQNASVSIMTKSGNNWNSWAYEYSEDEKGQYIDKIIFYYQNVNQPTDFYIFGKVTTLEEACNWYSKTWTRDNMNHDNINITVEN